jgi:hypothetical protein
MLICIKLPNTVIGVFTEYGSKLSDSRLLTRFRFLAK